MWSAHSYYMVEVMLVRYVNINARCRASGVLVPLACVVGGKCTRLYISCDVHSTAVQIEDYEIWASCIVPHEFIWG